MGRSLGTPRAEKRCYLSSCVLCGFEDEAWTNITVTGLPRNDTKKETGNKFRDGSRSRKQQVD